MPYTPRVRLAFVDLEYAWPPPGGAQVDLCATMRELAAMGHEVRLFCPDPGLAWRHGKMDEDSFPHPVTQIAFDRKPPDEEQAAVRFREAVDAYKPDVVFLCFGLYLKVRLARALAHYPVVSRFYAYELLCIRDMSRYINNDPCPHDYLRDPNRCRRCYMKTYWPYLLRGKPDTWVEEFLAAGGLYPGYHKKVVDCVRGFSGIIVYNEISRKAFSDFNDNVHVVTGGVDVAEIPCTPTPEREAGEKKIIFMCGRADDVRKGYYKLVAACDLLARRRDDFEVWVTLDEAPGVRPYLRFLGWQDHAQILKRYEESDICVVPSQWDEPFGLVAVESMAAGRPVVVGRVGGLQHIPIEGVTGFTTDRHNEAEMAGHLDRLLDDAALRRRMGEAGRARVEEFFDWKQVVRRHYPAILESVVS